MMKAISNNQLGNISGGNSYIDGACYAITGTDLAFAGATAAARYFGKVALRSALKSILGGPVGVVLTVATIGCFAYAGYQRL